MQIVERDLHLMNFAGLHGRVTAGHINEVFFENQNAAYRRLKKLVDAGYLKHDRVFHNRGGIYRVAQKGMRLAGLELPPAGLDVADLEHDLAVVDLSSGVLGATLASAGTALWITEREIRHADMRRRREKGTGRLLPGRQIGKIPDGLLVGPGGERIAVELEIAPKRTKTYRQILLGYAHKHRGGLPEAGRRGAPRSGHLSDYVGNGGTLDGVALYFRSPAVRERVRGLVREVGKGQHWSKKPRFFLLDAQSPKAPRMTKLREQLDREQADKAQAEEQQREQQREQERLVSSLRLTEAEVEHALELEYEEKNRGRRYLKKSLTQEEEDRALREALGAKRARARADLRERGTRQQRKQS